MPVNQFWSLPLTLGQFGSGSGTQPFKTVSRLRQLAASFYGLDGFGDRLYPMQAGYVLPTSLIVKVIPQFKDMVVKDPTKSLYYGPFVNARRFSRTKKRA